MEKRITLWCSSKKLVNPWLVQLYVFHPRVSPIKDNLPSKVVLHQSVDSDPLPQHADDHLGLRIIHALHKKCNKVIAYLNNTKLDMMT